MSWITKLAAPAHVRYVFPSTRFHDGSQAPTVRLLARRAQDSDWEELLPRTAMVGHGRIHIDLGQLHGPFIAIRVQMFPDGGLTRLGLYGELPDDLPGELLRAFVPLPEAKAQRYPDAVPASRKAADPALSADGGRDRREYPSHTTSRDRLGLRCVRWTPGARHQRTLRPGLAIQVISPFPPLHMFDGPESARSPPPVITKKSSSRSARASHFSASSSTSRSL